MYKFKDHSFMLIIPTKTSKWRSLAEEVLDICPKSQEVKLETFTSIVKMTVLLFTFIFYLFYNDFLSRCSTALHICSCCGH